MQNRGTDILGTGGISDVDYLPWMKLSYANGPGYYQHINFTSGDRLDPTDHKLYKFSSLEYPATVPLDSETHSGDDVAVYALGPWAYLFDGNFEQNAIPHMMAYSACIGDGLKACTP